MCEAEKSGVDEPFSSFDREELVERATEITFDRLHQLVRKGYKPDFTVDDTGTIWLNHPSDSFQCKRLILYPSGLLVSLVSDDFRFHRDDQFNFQKFLNTIPRPTLLDRTRDFRVAITAWIVLAVAIGGLAIILRFLDGLFSN
jgi:hypothetical protein